VIAPQQLAGDADERPQHNEQPRAQNAIDALLISDRHHAQVSDVLCR
jgi:hypothetical protein